MADSNTLNILLVMVSANPGVGGLEKHTRELANGLAKAGHRVTVICATAHQHGPAQGIGHITLNPKQSRYNPLLLARLYKQIRDGKYDLVHAQGTKAAALIATLARFSHSLAPALVASFHGFKSRYPALHRFTAVIAVSNALAQHLPCARVHVVYNGLPAEYGEATPSEMLITAAPKPVWLAVGRLVSVKGFDFLIDSFKDVKGCLYIAGDGPDKALLQQKILDNELQHRVTLLGHRDDIPALMAACNGVVISSQREGFSYVFAEAMLVSKPVISTNVPIANEFLPEQHIYRSNTPDGFASLLNGDLDTVYQDQAGARERAYKELTIEAMINSTVAVYHKAFVRS
ncbi:glycosyltransferase [Marinobacter sp. LV10MA510-1]|uniref:glycosyltransferase n=1 Tax=Marinobacter sp. LV10MA510-1 TaxID=1415567 RepID=UPI000BF9A879|nr:glycosyltransferase [Marinobacter sp. LV10MA510-1]PFG09911.1 glycosyltransferase involved in cell wall biosynthesis [Marinobacter sp. LV10MA510-1]